MNTIPVMFGYELSPTVAFRYVIKARMQLTLELRHEADEVSSFRQYAMHSDEEGYCGLILESSLPERIREALP